MADDVTDDVNGSLLSLNGSKGAWLEPNASSELDAIGGAGGAGAARNGALFACFGGAGRGGGALLFFGGSAGVGLSDLMGGDTVCDVNGSTPKGSDWT